MWIKNGSIRFVAPKKYSQNIKWTGIEMNLIIDFGMEFNKIQYYREPSTELSISLPPTHGNLVLKFEKCL